MGKRNVKRKNKKENNQIKKDDKNTNKNEDLKDDINNNNKQELSNDIKDIDLQKISKAIDKELSQNLLSSPNKNILFKEEINKSPFIKKEESLYKTLQNNYIKNNFNINIISMITQLINISTTLPKELKNRYPLNNILLDIVKELMFTDLEIVYYSLFLDIFGWTNEYYDVKDNLIITGLSVKKFLNKDTDIIENHLDKKYENLYDKFNNWINSQNDFKKNISFNPMIVNERNNLLKKPFNCYCRNNYIDYNDAVDKILQLSLPYNEINKHTKKNNKNKNDLESNVVDLTYGEQDTNEINTINIIPKNISILQKKDNINNNIIDDKNMISFSKLNQNNINNINNKEGSNLSSQNIYNTKNKNVEDLNNNFMKLDKKENSFYQTIDFNDNIGSKEFLFNPSFMKNSSDILFNKSIEPSFMNLNNLNLVKKPSNSFI